MLKNFFQFFILFLFVNSVFAQSTDSEIEKYPVFPECSSIEITNLPNCFNNTIQQFVFNKFKMPEIVSTENYIGKTSVFFEVDKEGNFKVLYVDAIYPSLKDEVNRVFSELPKIEPATYNSRPAFAQFTMEIKIPLVEPGKPILVEEEKVITKDEEIVKLKNEYEDIQKLPYKNQEYSSNVNVPLSHHNYSLFDPALNRVGQNNHTAQKPYIYSEVNRYYNFEEENQKILKSKSSWFGRKLWNEHLITIANEDYWLTLDAGVDLQVGKDLDADINTYNNTRLVYTQGGLGKDLSFFAVIYESQGRFADYFNRYARSIRADGGGNPAIIPGRGIAKQFRTDSFDYPIATGHISYTPSKYFNFQLGHGKQFIGDGYRSLFFSDNASSFPFFKINTTFWKIKYTNTYTSLRDVRREVVEDGSFRTKYLANHYLSYNVTKRLNIGLFESVLWQNDNDRGFDFNYVNPIIFYRAIEFSTGSQAGNALIGISGKYKISDRVNVYGQWIIDEFSGDAVFAGNGSYQNKTGYQLGAKYYDAFGFKGLYLQAEYNRVRPFTYSHNTIVLNYGHNNQPLAHTLGSNFSEFVGIARYQKGRLFGDLKIISAKRGLEFDTDENPEFYGGDIYGNERDRIRDLNNEVGQGNTTNFFHTELQAGYLINPATNLKLYGSVIFRDFKPLQNTAEVFENQTTWINFGLRTDLFNWYYDF